MCRLSNLHHQCNNGGIREKAEANAVVKTAGPFLRVHGDHSNRGPSNSQISGDGFRYHGVQ